MNPLEKRLTDALHAEVAVDPARLERTILEVRAIAQPQRIGFGKFILMQVWFSGVRMWIWQGAVLLFLVYALNLVQVNATLLFTLRLLPFLLGCCGVVAVTAAVPLVYRSVRYRMRETEFPCYFSGGQQLLARLLFILLGLLLTWAAAIGMVVGHRWLGLGCAVLYVCVPSCVAACGYLTLLTQTKWEWLPALGGALSGGMMLAMRLMLHFGWYPKQFGMGSAVLCVGLVLLCAVQVRRLVRTGSAAMG